MASQATRSPSRASVTPICSCLLARGCASRKTAASRSLYDDAQPAPEPKAEVASAPQQAITDAADGGRVLSHGGLCPEITPAKRGSSCQQPRQEKQSVQPADRTTRFRVPGSATH